MPPNFAVTLISGWHLSFPLGLAGRRFPDEGACKSHPPFNLHTFRPCQPPRFPPILAALHSLPAWLKAVFAKSPQTGQKRCQAVCLSTFPKQGHKSPHGRPQGVTRLSSSLSNLPDSMAAKGWKCTAVFTEIEKGAYLSIKRLVPVSVTDSSAVIAPKPQYAAQSLLVFS